MCQSAARAGASASRADLITIPTVLSHPAGAALIWAAPIWAAFTTGLTPAGAERLAAEVDRLRVHIAVPRGG